MHLPRDPEQRSRCRNPLSATALYEKDRRRSSSRGRCSGRCPSTRAPRVKNVAAERIEALRKIRRRTAPGAPRAASNAASERGSAHFASGNRRRTRVTRSRNRFARTACFIRIACPREISRLHTRLKPICLARRGARGPAADPAHCRMRHAMAHSSVSIARGREPARLPRHASPSASLSVCPLASRSPSRQLLVCAFASRAAHVVLPLQLAHIAVTLLPRALARALASRVVPSGLRNPARDRPHPAGRCRALGPSLGARRARARGRNWSGATPPHLAPQRRDDGRD